jgi:hypothetical protein
MNGTRRALCVFASLVFIMGLPSPGADDTKAEIPKGPYFGQPAPAMKAEVFAPNILSTKEFEHGVPVFAADGREFYLTRVVGPPWRFENLRFRMATEGSWSREVVSFDHQERHAEFQPSRDGKRLYCCSLRPLPGRPADPAKPIWNLWVRDLEGKEPSRPLPPPVNSESHDCQIFEAADGSFYFTSWRSGQPDLFRVTERDGQWTLDPAFGPGINSGAEDKAAYVSDDGRLLLFQSNRPGGQGKEDVYLCRREADGRWSAPVNAGPLVNSEGREWYPRLSPDGRYLFFISDRTGDFDIYWIDAAVLAAGSADPVAK